jgi:hypothetical protein
VPDVLPDSRTHVARGVVRAPGGNRVPIFCANCAAPYGTVHEELVSRVFALCSRCEEVHGIPAHLCKESDADFWEKVLGAQIDHAGRPMTEVELVTELDDPDSLFTKLAHEWRSLSRKVP